MKKKGFTLVELLAVIAILAILVVIAMPNVLGMFNSAKSNTFVTEVQTMMDTAKTQFTSDQLSSPGPITYSSTGTTKLDMDGKQKEYRIAMDVQGNITEVTVMDASFCYTKTSDNVAKTDVVKDDVKLKTDSDTLGTDAASAKCNGDPAK